MRKMSFTKVLCGKKEFSMIEVLTDNHREKILEAFRNAGEKIAMMTPFLSEDAARSLAKVAVEQHVECSCITRFEHQEFLQKSSRIEALEILLNADVSLYALKKLHTKLYLVDDTIAILGSANFTYGGLQGNHELSLYMEGETELLDQLWEYFEDVRQNCRRQSKTITAEEVEREKLRLKNEVKQANPTKYTYSFGAVIQEPVTVDSRDLVQEFLGPERESHCWIKFEASSRERRSSGGPYTFHEQNGIYMTRFSQARKPKRMHEGDIVYIAVHSWDRNGNPAPMIAGRARCHAFRETNVIPDGGQWPVYLELYDVAPSAGNIQDGICLYDLVDALGKDTYTHTQGGGVPAESIRYSHRQQAYLGLTEKAEKYLEQIFKPRDKES